MDLPERAKSVLLKETVKRSRTRLATSSEMSRQQNMVHALKLKINNTIKESLKMLLILHKQRQERKQLLILLMIESAHLAQQVGAKNT